MIVAGLGGGTGGGASPLIARWAREAGALTLALVTLPFSFEGCRRAANAAEALAGLQEAADAVIAIPCDGLWHTHHSQTLHAVFAALDDLLTLATRSLVEPLTVPGLISVDPVDVGAILRQGGCSRLGVGRASGPGAGRRAAEEALASPFLGGPIRPAPSVFFSVRGGVEMPLGDVVEASETLAQATDPWACLLHGALVDPSLPPGQVEVTLVATGL